MTKRRGKGEGTVWFDEKLNRWIGQLTLPNGKKKTKKAKPKPKSKNGFWRSGRRYKTGIYLTDDTYTVSRFFDRYFADIAEHTLAPRTILSYQNMRKHIEPALGNVKLSALRVDHLQKLYSDKLNEGLSRRTVQYIHQFFHTVLNSAVKWGLVVRNVADQADAPSQEKEPATVLTVAQARNLLELAREDGRGLHSIPVCHFARTARRRNPGTFLGFGKLGEANYSYRETVAVFPRSGINPETSQNKEIIPHLHSLNHIRGIPKALSGFPRDSHFLHWGRNTI